MKLDSNYTITSDANNVILNYESIGEVNPKTGKPTITKNEWFYKNLEDALVSYVNKSINPSNDAQSVLEALSEVKGTITSILSKKA